LKILLIFVDLVCKKANFAPTQNLPFCWLSSVVRERLCLPPSEEFLTCCRRKSGQTVLINKVDFGRCGWRMPLSADRQAHPSASHKQSRTRNKISWKSADQGGRQARLLPTEAERGAGDVGARQGGGIN